MNALKFYLLLFCLNCLPVVQTNAAIVPVKLRSAIIETNSIDSNLYKIVSLSPKEIQYLTGHKLNFKEKLGLKLLKRSLAKAHKRHAEDDIEKIKRKALWAKWLGIGSLIGLFIPGLGILSLPAAIVAIVFGSNTINKVADKRNSRQGITFGIITLSIIVLLTLLVIAIVAALTVG